MSKQKKIMFLGGIYYLKPAIDAAHAMGLYVITADYLPNNIAHQWADEYVNVSIIDKDAVLKVAMEKEIDGILSFAVDPGVVSAAYVAEQMGLPFACSYKSAYVLQDKALFRQCLRDNGFNVPFSKGYADKVEAIGEVMCNMENGMWSFPIIVKPTDSAGSKGVTKVEMMDELEDAIDGAFEKSLNHQIIIEQFLEKEGVSSGSESFVVDGKVVFDGVYDQYFDPQSANIYTPAAEFWPSTQSVADVNDMHEQLQRLMALLGVRTGLFNVEWRKCTDGKVYLMEVSPRAGGNRLVEVIQYATGVDLSTASVCSAIGEELNEPQLNNYTQPVYDGYWTGIVLHASQTGKFERVTIAEDMKDKVKDLTLYVKPGDRVGVFDGANSAIGSLFVRFDTNEVMQKALTTQDCWIEVAVK